MHRWRHYTQMGQNQEPTQGHSADMRSIYHSHARERRNALRPLPSSCRRYCPCIHRPRLLRLRRRRRHQSRESRPPQQPAPAPARAGRAAHRSGPPPPPAPHRPRETPGSMGMPGRGRGRGGGRRQSSIAGHRSGGRAVIEADLASGRARLMRMAPGGEEAGERGGLISPQGSRSDWTGRPPQTDTYWSKWSAGGGSDRTAIIAPAEPAYMVAGGTELHYTAKFAVVV